MMAGYRTYLIAACVGVVWAAYSLGMITREIAETLTGFLMAGGLATLRASVGR